MFAFKGKQSDTLGIEYFYILILNATTIANINMTTAAKIPPSKAENRTRTGLFWGFGCFSNEMNTIKPTSAEPINAPIIIPIITRPSNPSWLKK
jgi:hypothetical protein